MKRALLRDIKTYHGAMLDVELKIKNYRCFGEAPTVLRIQDGFTALIGVNSSGKSSLLRLLYEFRSFFAGMSAPAAHIVRLLELRQLAGQSLWRPEVAAGERAVRAGSNNPIELQIIVHDGPKGPFEYHGEKIIITTKYSDESGGDLPMLRTASDARFPELVAADFHPLHSAMRVLTDTMYIGPFRNAINIGGQGSYYDIQTGNSFITTYSQYKSGTSPHQNEAVYDMLQHLRRIFGYKELEINPAGDTLQLIIDGRSYRLSEQGAGLSHFIIAMVNVFVRRPSLLLIDEPELNLHASLQLDFLQTLARYTTNGTIFATHSLGLARTAADRIQVVTKSADGTSTVKPYEDNSSLVTLVGQLSFGGSPDVGFKKVLLVEGKTELRALMVLLRLYHKEHEVLMIPLHGADMIRPDTGQEIADLCRISSDVRYLIDSERTAEGEALDALRQGFVDMCDELGITGHVLERRALENYFSDPAVKRAFGGATNALGPYEKLGKTSGSAWRKTDHWKVAQEMDRAEVDATDLGAFLRSL